jgi:hypothetical protein
MGPAYGNARGPNGNGQSASRYNSFVADPRIQNSRLGTLPSERAFDYTRGPFREGLPMTNQPRLVEETPFTLAQRQKSADQRRFSKNGTPLLASAYASRPEQDVTLLDPVQVGLLSLELGCAVHAMLAMLVPFLKLDSGSNAAKNTMTW